MKNICLGIEKNEKLKKDEIFLLNINGNTVNIKLPDLETIKTPLKNYNGYCQIILDLASDINLLNRYILLVIKQNIQTEQNTYKCKIILNDIYNAFKKHCDIISFVNPITACRRDDIIYTLRSYKEELQIIYNRCFIFNLYN